MSPDDLEAAQLLQAQQQEYASLFIDPRMKANVVELDAELEALLNQ
jgi:hypothetical protein